jgi:hypothetical protein
MLGNDELIQLKQRLMVGAAAAERLAKATSDVFLDAPEYEVVMESLAAMKVDVRRLLAEHDILRGMFAERLGSFLMEEIADAKRGGDVASLSAQPTGTGGESERQVEPSTGVGVPEGRVRRRRSKRSKSPTDTRGVPTDQS